MKPICVHSLTCGCAIAHHVRLDASSDLATPVHSFAAFDLLQQPHRGVILSEPLSVRRDLLAGLLADVSPAIALCPQSADVAVAQECMSGDWVAAGLGEIVVRVCD